MFIPTTRRYSFFGLEDVALVMRVSVPTLNRRYREESGYTVMDRLNTFRLDEAARLLRETSLPVKEIADRVGFPHPSYFCRCFRRRFDCSPNQHRGKDFSPRRTKSSPADKGESV